MKIGGSKNASLPVLAASLLTEKPVRLRNVPRIADTALMTGLLERAGCAIERDGDALVVRAEDVGETNVDPELARRMRASIVLLAPLLARAGAVRLPKPGGDEIGMRRVEQSIRGLTSMGATIEDHGEEFVAQARDGLRGARIVLDLPTVTGTENLVMAAVLARGRTEILNAAREPHVQDLCRFLNSLGAQINGIGTDTLLVDGVEALGGGEHTMIADYLEAGTFAIAVAAAGGDVMLEGSPNHDLEAPFLKLREAGVEIDESEAGTRVRRLGELRSVDLSTWVHPGYPTDLQAPYTALMTQAEGLSVVSEYIFENRFQHVLELVRMGADIRLQGRTAFIRGPRRLQGVELRMPDIRAGAALVVAALCAEGTSTLGEGWHIERGYEDMPGKLRALGAEIEVQDDGSGAGREGLTYE